MSNTCTYSKFQMCTMDWNSKFSKEVRGLWLASWVQEGFVGKRPVQELLAIVLEKQRIFQGVRRKENKQQG